MIASDSERDSCQQTVLSTTGSVNVESDDKNALFPLCVYFIILSADLSMHSLPCSRQTKVFTLKEKMFHSLHLEESSQYIHMWLVELLSSNVHQCLLLESWRQFFEPWVPLQDVFPLYLCTC